MENVNHPKHYSECSIECLDMMVLVFGPITAFDFCITNAFKYLWRWKYKNGVEDLHKAEWYLNKSRDLKVQYGIDCVNESTVNLMSNLLVAGFNSEVTKIK